MGEMTGRQAVRGASQGRIVMLADLLREDTPGMESASSGATTERRRRSIDRKQALPSLVESRDRRQEPERVRMPRVRKKRLHRSGFDHAARIKDRNAVDGSGDDAKIVRDQNHAEPKPILERSKHLENLRLNGYVEGRGRLVGDQKVGIVGDCHGNHGPLPHAPRELVRVLPRALPRLRNGDQVEELDGPLLRVATRQRRLNSGIKSASTICAPTVRTGLSADNGSWKIIAMRDPRILFNADRFGPTSS